MQTDTCATARVLEIGDNYYFKAQYPHRTTLLWTGVRLPQDRSLVDALATPGRVLGELRAAARGRYDVVVVYPMRYSGWHPRYWARALVSPPFAPWAALTRAAGVSAMRFVRKPQVPLVAIDMDDSFNLSPPGLFLLDMADVFLKRELPVDRWQLLSGSLHPHIPTLRFRRNATWRNRIAAIQPVGLPQWMIDPALTNGPPPQKTADVFFAGAIVGNSTVRETGIAELERLKARGIVVDLAPLQLGFDEYQRRMSAAWLAWSPEGRGWHCNRHYEAALVQTVPMMNFPTVIRHAPLQDGVHAFHYAPEPGGLETAVISALGDKPRLRRMALAARDHAVAHHTREAYCNRILRLALENGA
jgi:hypothetical protein